MVWFYQKIKKMWKKDIKVLQKASSVLGYQESRDVSIKNRLAQLPYET